MFGEHFEVDESFRVCSCTGAGEMQAVTSPERTWRGQRGGQTVWTGPQAGAHPRGTHELPWTLPFLKGVVRLLPVCPQPSSVPDERLGARQVAWVGLEPGSSAPPHLS